MTLVIVVGTGISDDTGCTNVCFCTVIRPPDGAAAASSCSNTQLVAAPIPRTGSVWLDAVCWVPTGPSRRIVALIRSGSIWRSSLRSSGSGCCFCPPAGRSVAATAVPPSRGTVTAVTAEAERNARRVAPVRPEAARPEVAGPETSLSAMSNIIDADDAMSTLQNKCADLLTVFQQECGPAHPYRRRPVPRPG